MPLVRIDHADDLRVRSSPRHREPQRSGLEPLEVLDPDVQDLYLKLGISPDIIKPQQTWTQPSNSD